MSGQDLFTIKNQHLNTNVIIEFRHVNGEKSKIIKSDAIQTGEIIRSVEISSSFNRLNLFACLEVSKSLLDDLEINLTNNDTKTEYSKVRITITLVDNSKNTVKKQFVIDNIKESQIQKNGTEEFFTIVCVDAYGYRFINNEYAQDTVNNYYIKSPVENVKTFIDTICKKQESEKSNSVKIEILDDTEKYGLRDDELTSELKELKKTSQYTQLYNNNSSIFQQFTSYLKKYNIKVYQDFNTIHVIQNCVPKRLPECKCSLSDRVSNDSLYYIADRNLYNTNTSQLARCTYKIHNSSGRCDKTSVLDSTLLIDSIILNNDQKEYSKFMSEKSSITEGDSDITIGSILYENMAKLLRNKEISIYIRGDAANFNPGQIITLDCIKDVESHKAQLCGDDVYNGKWIILDTTYKFVYPQYFFVRLTLIRLDNPIDLVKDERRFLEDNIQEDIKTTSQMFPMSMSTPDMYKYKDLASLDLRNYISRFNGHVDSLSDLWNSIAWQPLDGIADVLHNVKNIIRNTHENISVLKNSIRDVKNTYKNSIDLAKNYDDIFSSSFNDFIHNIKIEFKDFYGFGEFENPLTDCKNELEGINEEIDILNKVLSTDYSSSWNCIFNQKVHNFANLDSTLSYKVNTNYSNDRYGRIIPKYSQQNKEEMLKHREQQLQKIRNS